MITNADLLLHWKDFLVHYFRAAYPLRTKTWTDEQATDYMLLHTWFEIPADILLEKFDPFMVTQILDHTISVIYNAKRHQLLDHPFVKACVALHLDAFKELMTDANQ